MLAGVLIFFFISASVFLLWYFRVRKYKDLRKLPGPNALQVFKNMFDNAKSAQDIFNSLVELNRRYGPVTKLWINPFKLVLVVSDIRYVEYFLTSTVHLDKSDFYVYLEPYIGKGLASSSGELWKKHKKLINQAFHTKIIEDYVCVFEKYWNQMVETLRESVDEESVDVFPILNHYTLQIICETFLDQKNKKIPDDYMPARTKFYSTVIERTMSLVKQNEFLYGFTGTFRKQQECVKVMRKLSQSIIDSYQNAKMSEDGADDARQIKLMEVLLGGKNFSQAEAQDHLDTIIIAGHDTSASVLSFGLFELAKHVDVQQKILDETNSILSESRLAEITFHDIQQMKYLECVLKEVLRLYAPVPFFDRKTKEDVVIDGVTIPGGTDVSICAINLHHTAKYFPDPEKFDPDRFMPGNVEDIPVHAFVPFSSGPRSCIGKNFAMLEMKSAIAKVVRNFELSPVHPAHVLELSTEFVLKSNSGMRIKLRAR